VSDLAWIERNQRVLTAAVARVKEMLERHRDGTVPSVPAEADLDGSALAHVAGLFGLSSFERDALVLAAAVELDGSVAALCAAAQGDERRPYPTFGLALAALEDAHWSAVTPAAPLRYWRLVELEPGGPVTAAPLRIDERVLHYLAGIGYRDERLDGLVEPVADDSPLPPSHAALARDVAERLAGAEPHRTRVSLCGPNGAARAIAAAACGLLGRQLAAVRADAIPQGVAEQVAVARTWEREAALTGSALLVDCRSVDGADPGRLAAVARFVDRLECTVLTSGPAPLAALDRAPLRVDVARAPTDEQLALWRAALGSRAKAVDGRLDAIVSQFDADVDTIEHALAGLPPGDDEAVVAALWDACRIQTRPRLEELAQRLDPVAEWDDLVLPELQRAALRQIAAHVRHRAQVYERWGFARKHSRGLGISALFTGASGTGKTMATEVLANELRLDLYRIDLSAVVSKYIGETEKNLRSVFDAAEGTGAILLFDEADALFGKRTEVKDSHDRYANIEVSYLLQRMEAYRGLSVLTTNLESALDAAFMRRLRFVVRFPFPGFEHRREIWRRTFPTPTPVDGIDVDELAGLDLAGGNIRNIGLNAAFLAADAGEPVRMDHVLAAARSEYAKLEQPAPALAMERAS
jgi:ATPase family associated with various cellular activities (AAA)/Winged helix domain, variant